MQAEYHVAARAIGNSRSEI